MDISELKEGFKRVEAYGQVVKGSKSQTRSVKTKRGDAEVADAVLEDATGTIGMSLWNQQIENVVEGRYYRVTNGYVTSFGGKLQLQVGQFGKIEEAQAGESGDPAQDPPDLTCPSCAFTNAGHPGWTFCPKDGEALG